ncbi:MAG TPA: hypothetical protein K8V90_03965 [Romboutsia timonensis]|uniref:Uncharacterized protein n=1 Tax=Romboutsia timonensis TaxID=1776391 RepID=A0A921MZN2_9FIRM|nr:hypothetical protein [Romboutsia timonensis]
MANYTIELRKILSSRDIFKAINYDFYEETYKPIFEEKFIKRFYFREIGVETIERFLVNLETTLNEIMPYYKHLYQTTTYKYDPILNYDVTETITREIVGELESNNRAEQSTNQNEGIRNYDTPIIKVKDENNYKKSPSFITDSEGNSLLKANSNKRENNKSNEINNRTTRGNIGVMTTQDLIKKEREIIINIDKMILDDLEILFMQVF